MEFGDPYLVVCLRDSANSLAASSQSLKATISAQNVILTNNSTHIHAGCKHSTPRHGWFPRWRFAFSIPGNLRSNRPCKSMTICIPALITKHSDNKCYFASRLSYMHEVAECTPRYGVQSHDYYCFFWTSFLLEKMSASVFVPIHQYTYTGGSTGRSANDERTWNKFFLQLPTDTILGVVRTGSYMYTVIAAIVLTASFQYPPGPDVCTSRLVQSWLHPTKSTHFLRTAVELS